MWFQAKVVGLTGFDMVLSLWPKVVLVYGYWFTQVQAMVIGFAQAILVVGFMYVDGNWFMVYVDGVLKWLWF